VVGATMAVVGARLLAHDLESIPGLAPELTQIILTPYLGDEKAQRVAQQLAA
jgi:hypothetical protein